MFQVLFEVHPKPQQWETYLAYARLLKPELESIDGFIDNVRYRSLTREGWILSLSSWRDEKALVRWRTQARHHDVQDKGRRTVFCDYHLRVGELMRDTRPAGASPLPEQRLDETEAGEAKVVTLIEAQRGEEHTHADTAQVASGLGLAPQMPGLVAWDLFEAVLEPGDYVLLLSWSEQSAAASFERTFAPPSDTRLRRVRVIRDYGMFDRREAPQYFPDTAPGVTLGE
ncbi:MAG TPA: antibiotic biosynthesis monooxygenase [Steroidobacteraceae bacterium]|jgi:heme-degrading monooxygenase HmoA